MGKRNFPLLALLTSSLGLMVACGSNNRSPLAPTQVPSPGSAFTPSQAAHGASRVGSRVSSLSPTSLAVMAISPSSGSTAGGTPITIVGSDFVEGMTVSLGDTLATDVIVADSTLMIATTPPHAPGMVDVVVISPDGQTATLSGYTYTTDEPPTEPPSSPAPTIDAITPSSGPATGGTRVTISGSAFANGATVSLGGVPAPAAVVTSEMVVVATTPPHAEGPVDVIVTNPDGWIATLGGGYTYTGDQPPVGATITITSFGVSPKEIEIPIGARVTFVNNDSRPHDIQSDPHPLHTDCPPINEVGFLNSGESKQTGQLRTAGACGYHDHDQASNQALRGRIVIR